MSSLQNLKILQLGTLDESSWRIWNRVLRQVSWQKPVTKFRIVRKKRAHEEVSNPNEPQLSTTFFLSLVINQF